MRKFIGLAVVIAFLWVSAAPAEALTLPQGPLEVDYNDWSGFYTDTDGNGVADTHQGGGVFGPWGPTVNVANQELRSLQRAKTIEHLPSGGITPTQTATEALDGLIYDLVVGPNMGPNASGQIGLVPGGRYATDASFVLGTAGGRLDMWLDTSPEGLGTDSGGGATTFQDPLTAGTADGPSHWVVGAGSGAGAGTGVEDDFPGVSDLDISGGVDAGASTWLIGRWVPMPAGFIASVAKNNPFATAVYVIALAADSLSGTGYGFVDVLVNNTGIPIQEDTFGFPGADLYIKADLSFPAVGVVGRTTDNWDTLSDDPVQFVALPEPATMSLLLVGLVGGAGAYLRRRRAA